LDIAAVENLVYQRLASVQREGLLSWIKEKAIPSMSSVRGVFFEQFAHEALFKGGTFNVKCLTHDSDIHSLTIPPLTPISDVEPTQLEDNH